MRIDGQSLTIDVATVTEIPLPIPGATPGGVFVKPVNVDATRGLVTTIVHIQPGARIPAHYHNRGAEAHFVLEGDFINAGITHGPGTLITHPKGVVHGPHESKGGCKVLTMQTAYVDPADPDFNIAE